MAKACIKRLHALEDDSLVAAIASQPTDVAKQICLLCIDEAESTGLGIYADSYW